MGFVVEDLWSMSRRLIADAEEMLVEMVGWRRLHDERCVVKGRSRGRLWEFGRGQEC